MRKFLPLVVLVLAACATPNLAVIEYQPPSGWVNVGNHTPPEIGILSNHQQSTYFKKGDRSLAVVKTVLPNVWYGDLTPQRLIKKTSEIGEVTVNNSDLCGKFKTNDSYAIETIQNFPYKQKTATKRSLYIVNKRDNGKAEVTKLYYMFLDDEIPNEFSNIVSAF